MYSPDSSVRSFNSSEIKNLNEEQIVNQIKSLFLNKDILSDSVFVEIIKEIIQRRDFHNILIQVVTFFWNLEIETLDPYIYAIINAASNLDKNASLNLLESIRQLLIEEQLLQILMLNIIPVLVSNIRREDNLFTGFIDISEINDHTENIVPIVKVLREMNTLMSNEKILLIKKLLDMLTLVDLEACPDFVNEILHLCDKNSFQFCVGAVVNFFNQRPISCSQLSQSLITMDSRRLIRIQTIVLNHYYEIAKFDGEFTKELLKFCKNNSPLYSISGFMCIILLNLAGMEYIRDQILEFMSSCIMTCYKDSKLFIESAFIREAVSENFDMDSLLLNAIKYCCVSEREYISSSLLELGFLLIKSGLPRSKVVSLKSQAKKKDETLISEMCNNDFNMSTQQKVGQAGIQMIIHLFKKLPPFRQLILDNIQNFILKESHKSSVFVYLELFADLIAIMPIEIFNYIEETPGQPISELLCCFPHDVALGLVNAVLPLVRYSPSIRSKLINVIMNNILSGRVQARMICVESALTLLKYLKVTIEQFGSDNIDSCESLDAVLLTQCSQFSCTQIASESKPLLVDNFANNEICAQILQIIDESCRQHPDTKTIIYKSLVQVIERNFYFSGRVVLFLLNKLTSVMNDLAASDSNPFILNEIIATNGKESNIQEPLSILISSLSESVRHCKSNMPSMDILSTAIEENTCISEAVSKAEGILQCLLLHLSNHDIMNMGLQKSEYSASIQQIIIEQFIDLYDVLIVHFICLNDEHNEEIEKLFQQKEVALKNMKSDKKNRKDNSCSSVISLSTLVKSIQHLFGFVLNDVKKINNASFRKTTSATQKRNKAVHRSILELSVDESNNNLVVQNDENVPPLLLNEKVILYLLNKAINITKKIGSSEYRVSYKNRKDICKILSDFVQICLGYYINCLCLENVDNLSSHQRQIMQQCVTLYCLSINKIIQFCTKTIDSFLNECTEVKGHMKSLQSTLGLIDNDSEPCLSFKIIPSISSFIKLHKHMVSRILLLSVRKLYGDIEGLISTTLNVAIYCGIEDARRTISPDITYGSNRINVFLLTNLNSWAYHILKSSKLHFKSKGHEIIKDIELSDTNVCRYFVSLWLTTSRIVMPDSVAFLDKFVADISSKIGSYNMITNEKPKSTFEFVIHPSNLLTEIINSITFALDDIDWLLIKWKCAWQEFKQRKAINSSQLSHLNSTPSDFVETSLTVITDQDRQLCEQLYPLCSLMAKLIQSSITNIPRLHSLVKLCTRLFDILTMLVKQYIYLSKSKMGSASSIFEKLVRISGGNLSLQSSQFIVYIQRIESISKTYSKDKKNEDDDDNEENDDAELLSDNVAEKKSKKNKPTLENEMSRTVKDIRLIPNLVFSIEQYQRYLIELQKVSKVDLMSHVKTLNSRDFRIDMVKLQESLDKNATVYITDEEDNEIAGSDVNDDGDQESMGIVDDRVSPPPKKQKLMLNKS